MPDAWGDLTKLRWTKLLAYAGDEEARQELHRTIDPAVTDGWYLSDDLSLSNWLTGLKSWGNDVWSVGVKAVGQLHAKEFREEAARAVRTYARSRLDEDTA